jgi:VanZ family protein
MRATLSEIEAGGGSRWRARLWRYGPVLVWMAVIFFASTGNLSASNTSRIVRPLLLWLFPEITEEGLLQAHFIVRKGAHLTEYAILSMLAARAFLTSSDARLRRLWYVVAFALVVVYALLDEFHQSFVQTRTGTIYDSLIDIAGGALGLLIVWAWRAWRRRPGGEVMS